MNSDSSRRPLIGVIGGLGPAATLDFYAKVLHLSAARSDQEHVRLIIDADPEVPNRNDSVAGTGPASAPALIAKARRLEAAGADLLVMPCNAAHAYLAEILGAVDLPFISIVDEAVRVAVDGAGGVSRVGILATSGTLQAGLYQRALSSKDLEALTLNAERLDRFMAAIYRVKAGELAGDRARALREEFVSLADSLIDDGAEVMIAACTEVPLVLGPAEARRLTVPLIDATEALAQAVVDSGARSSAPPRAAP